MFGQQALDEYQLAAFPQIRTEPALRIAEYTHGIDVNSVQAIDLDTAQGPTNGSRAVAGTRLGIHCRSFQGALRRFQLFGCR